MNQAFSVENLKKHWQSLSSEKKWVEFRSDAQTHLNAMGLPNRRHEDFKYTNLKHVAEFPTESISPAQPIDSSSMQSDPDFYKIVFMDGKLQFADQQLETGLSLRLLKTNKDLEAYLNSKKSHFDDLNPVFSLNTASLEQILFIEVDKDTKLNKPIRIMHEHSHKSPLWATYRVFIEAHEHAHLSVFEEHLHLNHQAELVESCVTEVIQKPGSQVHHFKLYQGNENTQHLAGLRAIIAKDARFHSYLFGTGAKLSRYEHQIHLQEPGAFCLQNGLYSLFDSYHSDHHTSVFHSAPHTESQQFYKGLLGDDSRGVFNGRVIVGEGAIKTNAQQLNKNIVLSDCAEVDTKPQLEIYNDDVKCSHGATVGQLRQEELFYFLSRGIRLEKAKAMLCRGFCDEILMTLPDESARQRWGRILTQTLESLNGAHPI